ncbi:MAG TPA: GDP-mannose 4,6-dehydratase [Candidatus Limnocylindrales bacterium]|nr:GDP-mannose 4,6-dehydratase [Candidatus Limnocylindrales bacterium]
MKKQETRSVLIVGGAGFIGSNLAHHLLTRTEAKVHVFDNLSRGGASHNLAWLRQAAPAGRLEVTLGDVRDAPLVAKAVADAGEIYHLAAQVAVTTSVTDPRLDFEINLMGTFNVLDAARRSGRRPFLLFTSTNKVYGDLGLGEPVRGKKRYVYPEHRGVSELQALDFHSPYGCSKGAADQYVRDFSRIYDLPTVVFRMSCIAGPRQFGTEDQGWVAHFLYSALQQRPVAIYGDGCQVRDVLCVHDLVRAFEAVRQKQNVTAGQIYNVGGGFENTTSLLELIDSIEELTGHRLDYMVEQSRPGDQLVYVSDSSKLHRDTGWKPGISLKSTLKMLRDFWEENQNFIAGRSLPASAGQLAEATGVSGRVG